MDTSQEIVIPAPVEPTPEELASLTPPAPTPDELIAQLRADLIAERADYLRLEAYIAEFLDADLPDEDLPTPGWEARDFATYWEKEAKRTLAREDRWRGMWRKDRPVPVMGDTVAENDEDDDAPDPAPATWPTEPIRAESAA